MLNEDGGAVYNWKTSTVATYNAQSWPLPFDNSHLHLYQPGGNFAIPSSIATDGSGNVYVGTFTPLCCGNVQVVKPDGSPRTPFDGVGNVNANVEAVSPDGTLYVLGQGIGIRRFNTAGTEIIDPNWLAGCGYFVLAVDANGKIYTDCGDPGYHRISVFNPDGTRMKTFSTGVENDAIAVDSAGKIYVADMNTRLITTYNADGSRTTPTIAAAKTTFRNLPIAIAVDGAGKIYVADSATNTVTTYDPEGTRSTPTITFGLDHPVSISVR